MNCKFQAGKIKNFITGGSFELRAKAAVLSFNCGPTWHVEILKKHFNMNIRDSIIETFC